MSWVVMASLTLQAILIASQWVSGYSSYQSTKPYCLCFDKGAQIQVNLATVHMHESCLLLFIMIMWLRDTVWQVRQCQCLGSLIYNSHWRATNHLWSEWYGATKLAIGITDWSLFSFFLLDCCTMPRWAYLELYIAQRQQVYYMDGYR